MMLTGFITGEIETIILILISQCFVSRNIISIQWDSPLQAIKQEYKSGCKGMYDIMESGSEWHTAPTKVVGNLKMEKELKRQDGCASWRLPK